MKILPYLLFIFGVSTFSYAQDAAHNWTIQLTAVTDADASSITLNWLPNADETPDTYLIWRKEVGTSGWGTNIGEVSAADDLTFTDTEAEIGISYEYYLQLRAGLTIYAWGYLASGIQVELNPNLGDLLILVDNRVSDEIVVELEQLEQDSYREGWTTTTLIIDSTATAAEVKAAINTQYTTLPDLQAVYILGHVAVPYSGELYPDAHTNHIGAWPADTYYADMDGVWTDATVDNTSSANPLNHNVPGDGKWDQSTVPSDLELQVSRVDFYDLPAFTEDEITLLKEYLNRAHAFKVASFVPEEKGLIDQGSFSGLAEGFAQNGIRNFTGFFGSDNVFEMDYWTNLNDGENYLWSFGCGGGSYTSASGLDGGSALTSEEFAAGFNSSTFTMFFGSYFGDWNYTNAFLRSAMGRGNTLSASWAGRPNWYYHNMALGRNIGFSVVQSQTPDSDYLSLTLGDGTFVTGGGVHVTQLGDPSLRMYYLAPPTGVTATNTENNVNLSWTASLDGSIEGYNVYRKKDDGAWAKANTTIIVETNFTDLDLTDAGEYSYLVKSVKLKENGSGTFYNESLGSPASTEFFASTLSEDQLHFDVFPNPTDGPLTIRVPQAGGMITLRAMDGKILFQEQLKSMTFGFEEEIPAGVYTLTYEVGNEKAVKRVVVN